VETKHHDERSTASAYSWLEMQSNEDFGRLKGSKGTIVFCIVSKDEMVRMVRLQLMQPDGFPGYSTDR